MTLPIGSSGLAAHTDRESGDPDSLLDLTVGQASPEIDFKLFPEEDLPLDTLYPSEEGEIHVTPEMVDSLGEYGNINPILVCAHPNLPGKHQIISGHHRWKGLGKTSRTRAKCIVIPYSVPEDQRLELDMQLNNLQKSVKSWDRAAKAERWLELHPDKTQRDCAIRFGCTETALSRDLAEHSMSAEFKERTAGLVKAVRQSLMTVKDPVKREEAVTFALTTRNGRLQTKEAVLSFIKRNRGGKSPGRKPNKALKGRLDGRDFLLAIKIDDNTEKLAQALEATAARMRKFKDAPPESLGFLFA